MHLGIPERYICEGFPNCRLKRLLQGISIVAANNILFPGAPEYFEFMQENTGAPEYFEFMQEN